MIGTAGPRRASRRRIRSDRPRQLVHEGRRRHGPRCSATVGGLSPRCSAARSGTRYRPRSRSAATATTCETAMRPRPGSASGRSRSRSDAIPTPTSPASGWRASRWGRSAARSRRERRLVAPGGARDRAAPRRAASRSHSSSNPSRRTTSRACAGCASWASRWSPMNRSTPPPMWNASSAPGAADIVSIYVGKKLGLQRAVAAGAPRLEPWGRCRDRIERARWTWSSRPAPRRL